MLRLHVANFCNAFRESCVGPRVVRRDRVLALIAQAAEQAHPTRPSVLTIPEIEPDDVLCGHGVRTKDPRDYVLAEYRGRVGAFLKRRHALPTRKLIAYLTPGPVYVGHPTLTPEEWAVCGHAHFVVTALFAFGPEPDTLQPTTFDRLPDLVIRSKDHPTAQQHAAAAQAWDSQFSLVADEPLRGEQIPVVYLATQRGEPRLVPLQRPAQPSGIHVRLP